MNLKTSGAFPQFFCHADQDMCFCRSLKCISSTNACLGPNRQHDFGQRNWREHGFWCREAETAERRGPETTLLLSSSSMAGAQLQSEIRGSLADQVRDHVGFNSEISVIYGKHKTCIGPRHRPVWGIRTVCISYTACCTNRAG